MRQAFLPSLASYYERTRTRVGTHEDGATRGSQSLSRCAGGETSLVLDIQGAKDGLDGLDDYYCPKGAKEGRPREDRGAPTWDQQPILTRPGQSTFFLQRHITEYIQ